ncbi:hypothetical protein EU545_04605 [Candidatus Thorarchaeota archaeon]|nr:MAG: hypothetical protein EU545_04605 [Candidatus Thorarchaeota archaeon]
MPNAAVLWCTALNVQKQFMRTVDEHLSGEKSSMLVVRAVENIPEYGIKREDEFSFYIVDAHHHMGREGGHQNTPSSAYEFYTLLWFELKKAAEERLESDLLLFEPVGTRPVRFTEEVFQARDSWSSMAHGWLVDRTIVFPFTDDYSKVGVPDSPSFEISNNRISGWTSRAPHSTRFIGFCRVDPNDAKYGEPNIALREIERCRNVLGLRGLKLHPLAQLFVEEIEQKPTLEVVKRASELSMPIVFDTRNSKTISRIANLIESIHSAGKAPQPSVILAHCGMSPGSQVLYEALSRPSIYGDTSSLHGNDVPVLFETAEETIHSDAFRWSEKLIFGSDYSFLTTQAIDVILFLLSREFPGTPSDIQRILGGNIIGVINEPFHTQHDARMKPRHLITELHPTTQERIRKTLCSQLTTGSIELLSIDYMIPPKHTWPRIPTPSNGNGFHFGDLFITVQPKSEKSELHIWLRRLPGDLVSVTLMDTGSEISPQTLELASGSMRLALEEWLFENAERLADDQELISILDRALA